MLMATGKHQVAKGTGNPWQPAAGIPSLITETLAHRTSEISQAMHTGAITSPGFVHCTHLPNEITLMLPKSLSSVDPCYTWESRTKAAAFTMSAFSGWRC